MAGYMEDRWLKLRPDKLTGKRERAAICGTGKRYRVKGIPRIQDRSFHTGVDAKQWLASAGSRRLPARGPGGIRRPPPPPSKYASGSRSQST